MNAQHRPQPPAIRPSAAIPVVILALSLVVGSVAGHNANRDYSKALTGFFPVMGILAFANPTCVGLFGAGFAAGVSFGCMKNSLHRDELQKSGEDLTLCGKVLSVTPGIHGNRDLVVRVTETLSNRVEKTWFTMRLSVRGTDQAMPGSRVRMRAKPGDVYRTRMLGETVYGKLAGNGLAFGSDSFLTLREPRRRLELLFTSRDDAVIGLLETLTLGERWEVGPSLRNILRRTGTYHLMAISGVHIGSALVIPFILFKALLSFLGKDGVGWKKVAPMAAGSVTLFVYLSLTGLSTSALRAGMFFVLYGAAAIAGRYPHPFSVLGWCVTLIVCLVPGDQPDMALYLSAAAVTGILVTGTHQCRHRLKILHVTMGAILFTLPLSVWCAGGISTVAPVCNLFAGLVFGLFLIPLAVLIDLMACVVSHPWEMPVDVWIGLAGPFIVALKWFSDPSSAFLVLSEAGCLVATAAGLISLVIWKGSAFSLRAGIALFLAVMLVAMGFEKTRDQFLNKETVLYFPRVGQADAAVLKGGGKTVIIDCAASGRPGQMTVLERRLVKMGVKRINALFLSHAHPDHAGGIRDLAGRWKIDVLYLPEFDRDPGRWSEVMEWVSEVTKIVSLKEEDELNIGPFSILVLGPPLENWERAGENARSLQLYVKWGDTTAFFAGDAPWEQVLPSLEKIPRLELMKIPHHGSRVGFPPDGLRSEVSRFCRKGVLTAVFPSPPPGTSSLPSREVVNWFEKQGARCLFTGQGEGLTFGTGEIARTGIF